VEKRYHIVGKGSSEELGRYLARNGHVLLPMVELIEQSRMAVDELIDVLGRAQIEAVLRLSAERIAGPPHPGKKGGAIGWHGREEGTVCLKERSAGASGRRCWKPRGRVWRRSRRKWHDGPRTKRRWTPPADHPWREAARRQMERKVLGRTGVAKQPSLALPSASP